MTTEQKTQFIRMKIDTINRDAITCSVEIVSVRFPHKVFLGIERRYYYWWSERKKKVLVRSKKVNKIIGIL